MFIVNSLYFANSVKKLTFTILTTDFKTRILDVQLSRHVYLS